MTGYGRAEQAIGDKNFLVEVRSLNGKQFDLRLNIPSIVKPFSGAEIKIFPLAFAGNCNPLSIHCVVFQVKAGFTLRNFQ